MIRNGSDSAKSRWYHLLEAIFLSFSNAHQFLGLNQSVFEHRLEELLCSDNMATACSNSTILWFKAILYGQTVFGVIFLFLLLLTIRVRFRMGS